MTIDSSVDQTIKVEQRANLIKVFKSYSYWFLGASILAITASIMADLINLHVQLSAELIRFMQVGSVVLEAVALGQEGRDIQTWGGVSPAEIWDERLHNLFSRIGFFLIILSFQLHS